MLHDNINIFANFFGLDDNRKYVEQEEDLYTVGSIPYRNKIEGIYFVLEFFDGLSHKAL